MSSNIGAKRCPSKWWTGILGIPKAKDNDSPTVLPTSKAPDNPGPAVYAIALIASFAILVLFNNSVLILAISFVFKSIVFYTFVISYNSGLILIEFSISDI